MYIYTTEYYELNFKIIDCMVCSKLMKHFSLMQTSMWNSSKHNNLKILISYTVTCFPQSKDFKFQA